MISVRRFISMQIRILGNLVFQLYLRLAVAKFEADSDAEDFIQNKITQTTIQEAYLDQIHEDCKYRKTYLDRLLDADARKMYSNWRTFIELNIGLYVKQWAPVKINEKRDDLPGVAASHTTDAAAAAAVRNTILYCKHDDLGSSLHSATLKFLEEPHNQTENYFLQGLIDTCRKVLEDAGVEEFPIRFYHETAAAEEEEVASNDEEEKGFKDDAALRMLPLLAMIIKDLNSYAAAKQIEFRDLPKKRFMEQSKNKRTPEKWFLNGTFSQFFLYC